MVGPKVLVGVPQETVERFSQKLRFGALIYSLRGVDFAILVVYCVSPEAKLCTTHSFVVNKGLFRLELDCAIPLGVLHQPVLYNSL